MHLLKGNVLPGSGKNSGGSRFNSINNLFTPCLFHRVEHGFSYRIHPAEANPFYVKLPLLQELAEGNNPLFPYGKSVIN